MMNLTQVRENFEKNGFSTSAFNTKAEAASYLLSHIKDTTVGIGGSMTIDELNIYDALKAQNRVVHWHWKQDDDARYPASVTDVYLLSANALSEDGTVINIDGNGNRISSSLFNHNTAYIVCGINKLAPDFEKALYRARNVASPMNAKRIDADTPCAKYFDKTGEYKCFDCSAPSRICRALTVLWRKPGGVKKIEIVFVHEPLGF